LDVAIRTRLTPQEGRRFAFTVGIAFLVVGAFSAWRGHDLAPRILWTLGGILLVSGLVIPGRLGPVYRAWMRLGFAIGKVMSPIVVGAMYFVVVTPVGVVLRVLGRNPLRHPERDGGFWMPASSDGRSDLDTQF
jgi:hypothetical protein